MKPWALWLIRHRMGFAVKALAVICYPLILLGYCCDAWNDVRYVLRRVDREGETK